MGTVTRVSYSPHPYLTQDVVDLFIQEKLENIIAILHRVHIGLLP